MDEELRRYLDAMLRKITDGQKIILKRLTSLERDFQNTKGFLLNDAVVAGRRLFDLQARVTRLERGEEDELH